MMRTAYTRYGDEIREAQVQDREFSIEDTRSGQIGSYFRTLDYEIAELQDVFAKLQDSLVPVLAPNQLVSESAEKKQTPSGCSPIAVDIMHYSESIRALRTRMEETLGMIDL